MEHPLTQRPGEKVYSRPLHFIWIADCSGSMTGEKIQSLNYAIRNAIPSMIQVAKENPNVQVKIRALQFSSGAEWHIQEPTAVENFQWKDLQPGGITDLGAAFSMLIEELKEGVMEERALPPVLVLLSDGQPTDEYNEPLKQLLSMPWGKKAVKISVAIGEDADIEVLQSFINDAEIEPIKANNSHTLVQFIKWASTELVKGVFAPSSEVKDIIHKNLIPIPDNSDNVDVW